MLFCNHTPLDDRVVNAIVLCRKSEFCEYITSLHIQHSIYVRQFEFFVFTMKQIESIFCNVSFAVQYMYGKSSSSSLVSIPNEVRTDLWLSSTSDAEKSVRLYVGFPGSELSPSSSDKMRT